MSLSGSRRSAEQSHFPGAGDLFSARSYSAWVRGTIRAPKPHADTAILFGSSISEPTDELVRLVREAFSEPLTSRYISVFSEGNRYVAEAIARRYGVPVEHVLTTTGVRAGLAMAVKRLVPSGGRVLVEEPGFDLLTTIVGECGARPSPLRRKAPNFRFDLDRLSDEIDPDTKLVIITNLHNPSGAHLVPDEIRDLASVLARRNAILAVDEVYADFLRPQFSMPAATLAPNIVSLNSLTKVFGLHALKCGWIIADPALLGRLQNGDSETENGISKLSHAVAAHVLESADFFDARWQSILSANRAVLNRHVASMQIQGLIEGAIPEFGCMYFPKVCNVANTVELARTLWTEFGIVVAPGEFFGLSGHIRIGFGEDANALDRGLTRLHAALQTLRGRAIS